MSESEPVQRDIAAIRTRMDQIESMQRLIVASNKDVKEHVVTFLSERENAPEIVVLLENGPLLQEDIGARLGKSPGPVSQVLAYLHDRGVLVQYKDPNNARKKCWGLNDLESTVNAVKIAKAIIAKRAKTADRRGSGGAA
jgi:hypothetical protein